MDAAKRGAAEAPSIRPKIYVDLASVIKVWDPLILLVVERRGSVVNLQG
jgi:hypothetical protein